MTTKETLDMDLSQITILPTNDGVLAHCQVCESHKTYRWEVTLDRIIGDMTDHLSRNHPTSAALTALEAR